MLVLVVFLIATFVIGGTRSGRIFRRWPALTFIMSFVVAISFYSLRVAQ